MPRAAVRKGSAIILRTRALLLPLLSISREVRVNEADGIANDLRLTTKTYRSLLRFVVLPVVFSLCLSSDANAVDPNRKISQYGHTAWRVQDGAVSLGSTITQTTDGYIWLGNSDGLMRFDGVSFTRWQLPEGQRLPGRTITATLGARDGSLWIGTTGGLSRLKNGQLKVYADTAKPVGINVIIEDHSGTIWATRYKLGAREAPLCSVSGENLRCFGKKDGIPVPFALGLAADTEGNLWFGSNVLCRWRPGTAATTYFAGISDKLPHDEGVVDVAVTPSGANAWASLDGTGPKLGVRYFSAGNWTSYVVPGFDGTKIWSHALFLDRNGSLWVGTEDDGIYRIHDGVADHYTMSDGLSGNSVGLFFEDKEGSMWVRTEGGLDMFRNTAIITYTTHQGLSSSSLRSVVALRDGSVWLATADGVNVLRKESESTSFSSRALPGHSVKAMLEDQNGAIWLAVDHTLMRFQNGRFREIRRQGVQPFAGNGEVTSIAEDENRRIWIVTSEGRLFSAAGDTIEEHALPSSASGSRKFFLAAAKNGLWIGSNPGSISYYREGEVQSVPVADSQGPIDIYGLFVDADHSLLVPTLRGLYRWRNGQLSALTKENGLPCDAVYSVIRDNHEALWIYSQCGIAKIDAVELARWDAQPHAKVAVTIYDSLDGAHPGMAAPYSPISSKAPDGGLWFAAGGLVQLLDPDHLHKNAVPPPVSVENIIADHKILKPGKASRVPALTRDIEIDYTALSFSLPQKIRFRYKLGGRDREWQEGGTRRQAFYTDLAPGPYHFRVIACNNDGVWNETGASLDFYVLPAYYQTTWFRAACLGLVLGLLWMAHRIRVRHIRHQFAITLDARVGERTRIARELHDTLLQSLQGLMLHFQTGIDLLPGRPVEARKRLETALDQADQAIAEGRDAVQGLRSSAVETNDLVSAVRTLVEELRADRTNQNSVDLQVKVEGTPRNLNPILRDEVYRIAVEALRNAFRHAHAQRIEVEILYGERWLRLRVRDDGKGIDPEFLSADGRAKHYGLHGMHERAKLAGGKLVVWSKLDSGAEVELSIPASTAYATSSRRRSWLPEKFLGKIPM